MIDTSPKRNLVLLLTLVLAVMLYMNTSTAPSPSSTTNNNQILHEDDNKHSKQPASPSIGDDRNNLHPPISSKNKRSSNTDEPVTSVPQQNIIKTDEKNLQNKIVSSSSSSFEPKYFPKRFLASGDAGGQIWEFSNEDDDQSSASMKNNIRSKSKTYQEIISEYSKCKGTSNISGIPIYEDVRTAAQTTPMWKHTEKDIDQVCRKRGTKRIQDPAKIPVLVYGVLFGFEVDILEIALHEALPVVDAFVASESTMTHAKHPKPVVFRNLIKSRLKRFADLVAPEDVFDQQQTSEENQKTTNYKIFPRIFSAKKGEKSGWNVERKQRREFSRILPSVFKYLIEQNKKQDPGYGNRPVIVISQLDLDEIPSRETLLYWKYCEDAKLPLRVLWFRYHLECQQELAHSRFFSTIWKMNKISDKLSPGLDLYSKRREVAPIKNEIQNLPKTLCDVALFGNKEDPAIAWHFSAFGGLLAVQRKNKHSPHSFVRKEIIREDEIRGCIFNKEVRTKLPSEWWTCSKYDDNKDDGTRRTAVMPVALPHFVSENICMFTRKGWMS